MFAMANFVNFCLNIKLGRQVGLLLITSMCGWVCLCVF